MLALLILNLPVWAGQSPSVQRGMPERQGHYWVEWDQCSVPVKPGGRLVLRTDMGSVAVRPGATDQVLCEAKLTAYMVAEAEARSYFLRSQLNARRLGNSDAFLEFRAPAENRGVHRLDVSFEIQVPLRFNLDLQTEGGGIGVTRLDGELRAVTAGGGIRAGDVTGPVRVETAGGDIDLGNINQRVDAHTAGGDIRVGDVQGDAYLDTSGGEIMTGMIAGTARAETAGGDVMLRAASGPVMVQTAGGQIQLGQCGGTVRAETAGGSIHLDGARGRVEAETAGGSIDLLQLMSAVRAETAAGHILAQIDGNRETFGASSLHTSVGDVQVFLPIDLPLTINAMIDTAAGHRISSDFPLTVQEAKPGDFGLGPVEGHGTLEGGGAPLTLHTAMGDIAIRKLDAAALRRLKTYQEAFWKNWQERWNERLQKARSEQQREAGAP
jgi:hypothetical protein